MKFTVRYWSSLFPQEYRDADGAPHWVDYSIHPASKLGLHNALLAVHDRNEILAAHGGRFGCAVFVVDDDHAEQLSAIAAGTLFAALPRGEVKWLDIRRCLLPPPDELPAEARATIPAPGQLLLFEHVHSPYDDLVGVEPPQRIDIDI